MSNLVIDVSLNTRQNRTYNLHIKNGYFEFKILQQQYIQKKSQIKSIKFGYKKEFCGYTILSFLDSVYKQYYVDFYQFNELIEKQLLNEIESECLDLSFTFLYAYRIIFGEIRISFI